MFIPDGPEDLTAERLTSAPRAGCNNQATVSRFEVEPLARDKGHNSRLFRVALEYADGAPAGPPSVVAKLSSRDARVRRRASAGYVREVYAYRELASKTAVPMLRCYHADIDTESGSYVLLLEDVTDSLKNTAAENCTAAQAELAVTEIARFHAQWWEHSELAELDWIPSPTYSREALIKAHDGWWPEFQRKAADTLPRPVVDLGKRLGPEPSRLMTELFGTSPRTLIHRDYNHNNMVFGTEDRPQDFRVFEWQRLSFGRGVWDVAYFMCQSLDLDTRRALSRPTCSMPTTRPCSPAASQITPSNAVSKTSGWRCYSASVRSSPPLPP